MNNSAYLDGYMYKVSTDTMAQPMSVGDALSALIRAKIEADLQGPQFEPLRNRVRAERTMQGGFGGAVLGGAAGVGAGALGSGTIDILRGREPSYKNALLASVVLGGLGTIGGGAAGALGGATVAENDLKNMGFVPR